MFRQFKHYLILLLLLLGLAFPFFWVEARGAPPSFDKHFADPLLGKWSTNDESVAKVFTIPGLSSTKTLKENIEVLFYPNESGKWGFIWDVLRYVGYIIVFIYLIMAGSKLIFGAKKPDDLKAFFNTLLLIVVGSAFYFGAVRLFWNVLVLKNINQTAGLKEALTKSSGFLFFLLSFLKAGAFFYAIAMIVWTGFKMMNPSTAEEWGSQKLVGNLKWIIAALVGMKVVDFIYYIASKQDFTAQAGNFIIQIAKFMAYLSGSVIVLMIIYSGYLLVIDGGKGENFKKAKTTLTNIVLAVIALFFFLFLLYQIFAEFN